MKQKYLLEKQEDNSLVVKEFGELEEGIFSLLCEEKFDREKLEKALQSNDRELMEALRTDNMFPPFSYAVKIAEAARGLYNEDSKENYTEILFDEIDMARKEKEAEEGLESEDELLDDILDSSDEEFDPIDDDLGEIEPKSASSLKVDEDTDLDVDL
ncbi:MAG: hypothetical protein ACQEQS_01455 [Thermodesulfobacteriota bacterium]